MGLRDVVVTLPDFDRIHRHLVNHPNQKYRDRYRNMSLRNSIRRNGGNDLRYLHAIYAHQNERQGIEGMISGPGVFWHYTLARSNAQTQINVHTEIGDPRALARIQKRFIPEIMKRIEEDQPRLEHKSQFTPGQFYIRRACPGMLATHRHCVDAVQTEVLDRRFVEMLNAWMFELLHP